MDRLSILVASYDEVQDILMLWDNKVYKEKSKLFKKYNLYYGLNFKAQNKLETHNKNFLYSETLNWGLSLEKWINQIDSQYILIFLDDHIIKNLSITSLESIIKDISMGAFSEEKFTKFASDNGLEINNYVIITEGHLK